MCSFSGDNQKLYQEIDDLISDLSCEQAHRSKATPRCLTEGKDSPSHSVTKQEQFLEERLRELDKRINTIYNEKSERGQARLFSETLITKTSVKTKENTFPENKYGEETEHEMDVEESEVEEEQEAEGNVVKKRRGDGFVLIKFPMGQFLREKEARRLQKARKKRELKLKEKKEKKVLGELPNK